MSNVTSDTPYSMRIEFLKKYLRKAKKNQWTIDVGCLMEDFKLDKAAVDHQISIIYSEK